MRALILSDIHGARIKYKALIDHTKPDVIILPGDIPSSIDVPSLIITLLQRGRRRSYVSNFYQRFVERANLRQIRSTKLILSELVKFDIPVLFIHGNTETVQTRSWMKLFAIRNPNLHYIADNFLKIEDILFIGHGWVPHRSNQIQLQTPGEIEEDLARKILLDTLGRAKQNSRKTILVSHSPPYGTNLDFLSHRNYHAGSTAVRNMLDSGYFDGVISGHLHESYGTMSNKKWWAINAGAAVEDRAILVDIIREKYSWVHKIIYNPGLETVIYQKRRKMDYDNN